jgi:RND family efflux transporter MFP subunit
MNMNKLSKLIIATVLFLAACSKQEAPTDKKAQLEALKKQSAELASQISTLEAELSKDTSYKPEEAKYKMVKAQTLAISTFDHFVEIQGKVDTDNNILVSPETAGNFINITVKRGDKVSKGKVLAEVDATLIKKGIEEVETSLELAKTLFEKQEKLYKENVTTEVQYLQAKSQKESLENRIASLKEQLKKTKIVAPIDGYVDELFKKEGEMAVPGMPAMRLVNYQDYKIVGELAESYISKVNEGDEVLISLPDAGKELKAKISAVASSINTTNRTFAFEIKISGTNSEIKPNMIAYLKIKDYSKPKSIVVPVNTVQSSRENQFVYLIENGKATKKVVTVSNTYGTQALVDSGLKDGDVLVTFGYNDLTEGQEVKY